MGILQFASSDIKRLELDGGDFLDVKTDISKREFNALMAAMPNREISEDNGLTLQEGLGFQQALFTAIVTGWSLPEEPTLDNYLRLGRPAADAVDAALIEHFNAMSPSKDEVSKVSTSRAKARRG